MIYRREHDNEEGSTHTHTLFNKIIQFVCKIRKREAAFYLGT